MNNTLSEHQIYLLRVFKAFDAFCSKNGIPYFACYGTLIGAIRHGGFIPWDDDLDVVMKREDIAKREVMGAFLKEYSIDFIVLAGFLVVVPDFLVNEYSGRMINLHPALLPRHGGPGMYGHHVHEAVKACGETETGMTVHWVSNEVDGGRIIARFRTAVELSDTPEEIAGKEHELEMAWFPKVVEQTILSLRSS